MIIDYYKNWDSDKAPAIMVLDYSDRSQNELEIEDQKKLARLRIKYSK